MSSENYRGKLVLDNSNDLYRETIDRQKAKEEIIKIIESSDSPELSKEEIKEINSYLKIISKWDNLKKCGISALPSGDATQAFNKMNSYLEQIGMFIVPVGELEHYIKEVGVHGPRWVNQVLEEYLGSNSPIFKHKGFRRRS